MGKEVSLVTFCYTALMLRSVRIISSTVGCSRKAIVTAQSTQTIRLSSVIVAEEAGKGYQNCKSLVLKSCVQEVGLY